jgi:hypothetical protein
MMQFYFLSVFTNLLAAIALSGEYLGSKMKNLEALMSALSARGAKLGLGIAAFAVGFLKLLIPQDVPVVGDLLPALGGMAMGVTLFFEYMKERGEKTPESMSSLEKLAASYKVPLGLAGGIISVLHFLLPKFLFL